MYQRERLFPHHSEKQSAFSWNAPTHVEGTSHTQVCGYDTRMGNPGSWVSLSEWGPPQGLYCSQRRRGFFTHLSDLLWGLSHHPTSAPLHTSWGFTSLSSATSPCPFSPSPCYCEVRILCLRHLGLLPWKQGRIKAGARSAGIRPLSYLSSRLNPLPQGFGCPPQAPRLAGRRAGARDEEVPAARRSPPGPGRGERTTQRPGQWVMGPASYRQGHLPSLGPGDRSRRGSHVGARRDFPSAGANFAALRNEPGCGRVVVRWSQGQILSS